MLYVLSFPKAYETSKASPCEVSVNVWARYRGSISYRNDHLVKDLDMFLVVCSADSEALVITASGSVSDNIETSLPEPFSGRSDWTRLD